MDIIQRLKEQINTLLKSNESAYSIGKKTGVDASQIQQLQSGNRDLEKYSLLPLRNYINMLRHLENNNHYT